MFCSTIKSRRYFWPKTHQFRSLFPQKLSEFTSKSSHLNRFRIYNQNGILISKNQHISYKIGLKHPIHKDLDTFYRQVFHHISNSHVPESEQFIQMSRSFMGLPYKKSELKCIKENIVDSKFDQALRSIFYESWRSLHKKGKENEEWYASSSIHFSEFNHNLNSLYVLYDFTNNLVPHTIPIMVQSDHITLRLTLDDILTSMKHAHHIREYFALDAKYLPKPSISLFFNNAPYIMDKEKCIIEEARDMYTSLIFNHI